MKQTRRLPSIITAVLAALFLGGCAGVPRTSPPKAEAPAAGQTAEPAVPAASPAIPAESSSSRPSVLDLTFAGDIMAHTVNYGMKEYGRIYDDVRPLLSGDDLTFGNLESPVADVLPLSTYPRFNVHTPYLAAAVEGGFDVFSLANNHSNDQGTTGITGTTTAVASFSSRIYASGLKQTAADIPAPVLIDKKGWKILFLSVTEILNAHDAAGKLVYYVAPTETSRAAFLADLERMRRDHPCDVFVLGLHLAENEYGRMVSDAKKAWFGRLAGAGVDIVWAHHPHVMQGWETVRLPSAPPTANSGIDRPRQALFMYSMGNFISGQRVKPAIENPEGYREYTGDAVLLQVRLSRSGGVLYDSMEVTAVPVTNYTDPVHGIVVRRFDAAFVDTLPPVLQPYFRKRSELMHAYLPLLPTTPTRDILVP